MAQFRETENQTVLLADGRSLCFAEYGSPTGFVVVNAHGGLACRLDVSSADHAARAAGVRLISPDRPGIGRSAAKPGRTIMGWADDVKQLMDHLGADRFAVMGWSMGGQYAAAVGMALAQRVSGVAIVAGALPLTEAGVFAELPAFDRLYTRLSERASLLARSCFRAMYFAARLTPGPYGNFAAKQLGEADANVLRAEGYETFARMSAEALRKPTGVVEDYRAWAKPWGFRPEDLVVPVHVWAGEDDQLVNATWAHKLARRIPDATLRQRPGGHFMAHLHYREIFETLPR